MVYFLFFFKSLSSADAVMLNNLEEMLMEHCHMDTVSVVDS